MHRISSIASRLDKLVRRLEKFSFPLVAQPLAGLLTRPENHTATARFEALIHLAALACRGTRAPTHAQMREWLNVIIFRDSITDLEDPVEDVFVSNVATWFGNARLFEGLWVDNDYYVQTCLAALSKLKDSAWATEAQRHVIALLRLSEAVAERAKVPRYTLTDSMQRQPLKITAFTVEPSRAHVTFSREETFTMGIHPGHLDPFFFQVEDAEALAVETLGHTSLERRPLVASDGRAILALPTAIGAAIRRFIIERASEAGELQALQSAIAEVQFRDVFRLGPAGWRIQTTDGPEPTKTEGAMDIIGTFDEGGYVQLIYVPDDLAETAREGLQDSHSLISVITKRIDEQAAALAANSGYRCGLTLLVHGGVGRGFAARFGEPPPGWQRLGLSIPDFMRLGWDFDMTALRAWKLLNQEDALRERGIKISNINGFLNLYAFAQHHDFELVPKDMTIGVISLAPNYLTPLRHRLRVTLDRHVAIAPDQKSWVEVQRETTSVFFRETQNLPIFISPGRAASGELLACVETRARPWWVECDVMPGSKRHRSIVLQVWEMARNWLIPLAPLLEQRLPTLAPGPVAYRLRFPDIQGFSDEVALAGGPPSAPAVEISEREALIDCPLSYLRSFASAQNVGDRLMIAALVRGAYALCGAFVPDDATVDALVQEVAQTDDARFIHLIQARLPREMIYAAVPLPQPRLQTPEDLAWSRLDLARRAGWTSPPGPIPEAQAGALLNRAVAAVWERIKTRLLMLDRVSVIERALLNHAAIEQDRFRWRLTAAALLALYRDTADIVQAANRREAERGLAGLASRVIAEMALCTSPLQGGACTGVDLDFLIAEVGTLLDCAGQSDALHHGLAVHPPDVHANGSLGFDLSFGETLQDPYVEAHGERAFRAAAADYGSAFDPGGEVGAVDVAFAGAFAAEFGLSLEQYCDFTASSGAEAAKRHIAQYRLPRSEVLRRLEKVGAANPTHTFGTLTLAPRPRWDEANPENAEKRDWYPWRYNRRLSIVRRPLVQLSTSEDPEVLIVPTLLDSTLQYLCEAAAGRLPIDLFDSDAMRTLIGRAVDRGGHLFNRKVAERLEQLHWEVRQELKLTMLGGRTELGDIDVLAWRSDTGAVYAIECKRLQLARTIGEIGERLTEYTTISETGDRTPIQKHLDRIAYLRSNLDPLAALTKIAAERLQLRSAIVTDYLVPMQFSEHALKLVDVVADYALLEEAFRPHLGRTDKVALQAASLRDL